MFSQSEVGIAATFDQYYVIKSIGVIDFIDIVEIATATPLCAYRKYSPNVVF
jgi:hypothetical protein